MIVLCRRRGFFAGAWRIYRMIPLACHPGSRRHAHTITSFERAPLVTPDMSFHDADAHHALRHCRTGRQRA
jgi:hypothetical protein